jgi:hypothetical protein
MTITVIALSPEMNPGLASDSAPWFNAHAAYLVLQGADHPTAPRLCQPLGATTYTAQATMGYSIDKSIDNSLTSCSNRKGEG